MDLSDDAKKVLKLAQGVSTNSIQVLSDSIRQLDSLPVSPDLHGLFWKQLQGLLDSSKFFASHLDGLSRYCNVTRSPQALLVLFERDPESLPLLMRLLSISPVITQRLVSDPEALELIRITKGQPVTYEALMNDLSGECRNITDDSQLRRIVARCKNREIIRIAFGQWFGEVSIAQTYRQLAILESTIIENTSRYVFDRVSERLGVPMHSSGRAARHMILAFDGQGGHAQGYDTLLRPMILAETNGRTNSNRIVSNADFYERFAMDWSELLMANTATPSTPPRYSDSGDSTLGETIYQINGPIQPQDKTSSWVVDLDVAFKHYDLTGRTWERELFVGARCVGGDQQAAELFLHRLQPWIYRRYVGDADIAGLGAMQRKLRRRLEAQSSHRSEAIDESRALGDLEQTIRFLQLLHGHQHPSLRTPNYFNAIDALHHEKVLTKSEYEVILETYQGLLYAKAAHELQADDFIEASQTSQSRRALAESIEVSRTVVRQRLESEFPEDITTAEETDLILDPHPNAGWITSVLHRHGFRETTNAYARLMEMARENGHILSTRKCRFYLSNIAPQLLATIAETPDPDWTLMNMERVTSVLGGKGILWELLSSSPPIMQLVVRICASSEYLVNLLTQSPGMIDDLLNSLLLDRLPGKQEMKKMLEELCRQTTDIDSVIRDFKSAMHLQVGVRDVMSKESVVDTHTALASIAEVCLKQIIESEYQEMVRAFGNPMADPEQTTPEADVGSAIAFPSTRQSDTRSTQKTPRNLLAQYVVIALGRLGGRDPNYHSDFSLVFLFDHDGTTQHESPGRNSATTSNRHFFEEWVQRIMKRVNRLTPKGRIFEVNFRFGPLGESGLLSMQLDQFIDYFRLGAPNNTASNIIDRQALCRARAVLGSPDLMSRAELAIHDLIESLGFTHEEGKELLRGRMEEEQAVTLQNIKRGIGGSLDVELVVHWLQLSNARSQPSILVPNTVDAINRLQEFGLLSEAIADDLRKSYNYVRELQSAIRLMNTDSRHDLPTDRLELEKLAYLLGVSSGEELLRECGSIRERNRELLQMICR
jgi:[glutamine synthetase] adenylyltransferase / [glutamine synthetase]-adenylyl-L-tyrosine phosphorylase